MKRIQAPRTRQVVGLGFGFMLLLALLIALINFSAYRITQWQNEATQTRSQVNALAQELRILAIQASDALRRYLESGQEDFLATYQRHRDDYYQAHAQLVPFLNTPEEQTALQSVTIAEQAWESKAEEVLRLYESGFPAAAHFLWTSEGSQVQDNLIRTIEALDQVQSGMSDQIIDEARQIENLSVIIAIILVGLLLLGGTAASLLITLSITKPISELVQTITRLGADLTVRVTPSGPQEIAFLGETINQMAENLLVSKQALQQHNERLENELNLASQMQASLLPGNLPKLANWEVAVFWQSARELGGDFYTYMDLGEGLRGIALGDVSGKGARAAMAGALTIGLLEAYAPVHDRPETLLADLNSDLCIRFQGQPMNVACCYLILDEPAARLTVSNAGGIYPYLKRGNNLREIEVPGMPLGAWPDFEYTSQTLSLCPGDLLLLSSDGLVEAQNDQGTLFGFDRLEEVLLSLPSEANAETSLKLLLDTVQNFTGNKELHDDMTLLVARFVGEPVKEKTRRNDQKVSTF